jgi:nicotinate-nucleotide adenylyltransferase
LAKYFLAQFSTLFVIQGYSGLVLSPRSVPIMPQKIAILGGTFNPIHMGHLIMAETALSQFALDRILWVPTVSPLYKSTTGLVDFTHRLKMVTLAIASHPQFEVSAVEQIYALSYAIDTFLKLQVLYPGTQWYWIIGLDAVRSLPQWQGRQELVSQCTWLVAPRGSTAAQLQENICTQIADQLWAEEIMFQWQMLEMPLVGISSRLVRQYCSDRHSIRYWVPDSVRAYIQAQRLYQTVA